MPTINPIKCFSNPFSTQILSTSESCVPANWLDLLAEQWAKYLNLSETDKNELVSNLLRHAGPMASYKEKLDLSEGLIQIYLCLNNQTERNFSEPEKKMILLILSSDIGACTPGFHNRVNQSKNLLQIPCSIERLLFQIRTELIDLFARQQSSNVHDYNKIFFIANKYFGVNVPNASDPYMDSDLSLTE